MQERRASDRLRADLKVRWEALKGEGLGSICDLSLSGCFVLASADVKMGELIRLEANSPDEVVCLWGEVVYSVAEMGFALRFLFGVDDQRRLEELLETLR